MSKHTKGPWLVADVGGHIAIGNGDAVIARIENVVSGRPIGDEDRANARRIVACVNACEGIPTSELELAARDGKFLHAYDTIRKQRDELLAALKRIADYDAPDAHAMINQAKAAVAKAEKQLAQNAD